jgi:hypothetical protein
LLRLVLLLWLLSTAATWPASAIEAAIEVEVAVESGVPAPERKGLFLAPSAPLLGGDGGIALDATLRDARKRYVADAVLRLQPPNPIEVLAVSGEPAPSGGKVLEYVSVRGFNAAGDVLLQGSTGQSSAYFGPGPGGPLDLIAYDEGPAPGLGPFDTFYRIGGGHFGDDGSYAFKCLAEVRGEVSTGNWGLWRSLPDAPLDALFLPEDPAPGMPGHALNAIYFEPAMDRAGRLAFVGLLSPFGSDTSVLFLPDGAGDWTPVLTSNDPAPGVSGGRLGSMDGLAFESDVVGFRSLLRDTATGGHPENPRGVWGGHRGEIALIAREGDVPPGFPPGYSFGEFGHVVVSASGAVAFKAQVRGRKLNPDYNVGIWISEPGREPRLVAFPGMRLARKRGRVLSLHLLGMTTQGDAMFASELTNGGGAVHVAPAGVEGFLTLVAKGDKVELSPGRKVKVKDVAVWSSFGGPPGQGARVYDDEWRFALRLEFGRRGSAAVVARSTFHRSRADARSLTSAAAFDPASAVPLPR